MSQQRPLTPREQTLVGLVNTFGPQQAAAIIADVHRGFAPIEGETSPAMRNLEVYCGVFRPTPVSEGPDMLQRMEGRREVYLHIRAILGLSPQDAERMAPTAPEGDDA